MIKLYDVHKYFGENKVLRGINLSFKAGEVVAILGSSGSGKSTMLRCINGLETIDQGDITVGGLSIRDQKKQREIRTHCGMVFQGFNLFPHLNVLENITLSPIKVLKKSPAESKNKALELLEKVGMAEKAQFYPDQLSGGQQQRVAIARALAMEPEALLLDEVTSALDPEMTVEVMKIIDDLAKEDVGLLVVTHEMGFAQRTADRILFLHEGQIYADETSEDFFASQDERIQQFISHISK